MFVIALHCFIPSHSSFTRTHTYIQCIPDVLTASLGPQEESIATEGKYQDVYETLGPVGRGAFGFVKLAKRKEDSLLVRGRGQH